MTLHLPDAADAKETCCKLFSGKCLHGRCSCGRISNCDMLREMAIAVSDPISLLPYKQGALVQKEVPTGMNKYELAVVLTTKIEDEQRAAVIEDIKAMIARFGGSVTGVDEWGRKRLAYEIQKMKEGYYYFITFEADPSCPAEIEQRIRIMENVIRYLCIRQDA